MEQQGIHTAVELWHLALAGIPVLIAFIAVDRHFWHPVRQWRNEMERWRVGVDKDLERGSAKMEATEKKLDCLDTKMDKVLERLTAIETLMRHSGGLPPEG